MPIKNDQRKLGTTRWSPRPQWGTAKAVRINRDAAKSHCANEWGGWGRKVMMDRDRITRTGARTPGVKRQRPLARWRISAPHPSTQYEDTTAVARCTKDGSKPSDAMNSQSAGRPRLIYRPWSRTAGKLTVRNLRGDDGNGGIIRSPIRAIILPDQVTPTDCGLGFPECGWTIP